MQEIMKLTALQLGAAIRRGEVSPTEAVKAALERIEETAGDNAFTEITAERALERAAWAEKELAAGRLAGLHQRGVHHLRLPDPGRVPPPL